VIDALRRSAAHIFVDDIDTPVPATEDDHHLRNVLRLRAGEPVTCSDGRGSWRECTWTGHGLLATGDVHAEAKPELPLTVAVSPLKGDRTDLVVEKLVEIGIDRIVMLAPVTRSVVRWIDDKVERVMERYARIARSAAMQSRRVFLPIIEGPIEMAMWAGAGAGAGVGVAEPGGRATPESVHTLIVGPEGGFTAEEIAHVPVLVDLGNTVLRAETAAIVGATRMVAHRARSLGHTG
jgi:16S rRNA (uracil1498-N3)-methyltransferase